MLIGGALRVGHQLLLRDPPEATALLVWLAVIGVTSAVLRRWGRGAGAAGLPLAGFWSRVDGHGEVLLALLLVLLAVFHAAYPGTTSDGADYFTQVHSLLVDGDLDVRDDVEAVGSRGMAPNYPIGSAFLWSPFFVAADLWLAGLNALGGEHPRDGLSAPYQRAIGLGSLLYGFAGLVLVYRLARRLTCARLALLATLALAGGSFLAWYLAVEASMAHANSFFVVSAFLTLWFSGRGRCDVRRWALLGAAAGAMTLVRYEHALYVLVPGLEAAVLYARRAGKRDLPALRELAGAHAVGCVAGAVVFVPQMLYWLRARGAWRGVPVQRYSLEWSDGAWVSTSAMNVLFSPDHGLFAWSPLLLFAVVGLVLLVRRDALAGLSFLAVFAGLVYVNGVVGGFGAGFGARHFASFGLPFGVGLAVLLDRVRRHPLATPAAVVGVAIVVNGFFMADVARHRLPRGEGITFAEMLWSTLERVGNPFSLPASLPFAVRFDTVPGRYDRLRSRFYNNLYIEVGTPQDEVFLLNGWSGREDNPDFDFRWATGKVASLVAPLNVNFDHVAYVLEVDAVALTHESLPRQIVTVVVNGRQAGHMTLGEELARHRIQVSGEALTFGYNLVELHFAYAATPRSLGTAPDRRELAAAFDRIALLKQ